MRIVENELNNSKIKNDIKEEALAFCMRQVDTYI
jgi:hypothetical protein